MCNEGWLLIFFATRSRRRNVVMNESVQLYTCYSLNLRNYLYDNGLKYKLAARNPNSNKLFWVYVKDKKLDELLIKWATKK